MAIAEESNSDPAGAEERAACGLSSLAILAQRCKSTASFRSAVDDRKLTNESFGAAVNGAMVPCQWEYGVFVVARVKLVGTRHARIC